MLLFIKYVTQSLSSTYDGGDDDNDVDDKGRASRVNIRYSEYNSMYNSSEHGRILYYYCRISREDSIDRRRLFGRSFLLYAFHLRQPALNYIYILYILHAILNT